MNAANNEGGEVVGDRERALKGRMSSATRFEAAVAAFVGITALVVSAYTAYVQRQQVRAQVYPILQFGSGANDEGFHAILENKGMGPALIHSVVITLDGKPVHNWYELLARVLGPGTPLFYYDSFGQRVLSPGESLRVLNFTRMEPPKPKPGDKPIAPESPQESNDRLMESRSRWRVSICYCSTLGDCWTLIQSSTEDFTKDTRSCSERDKDSFN
jgi:hypothetical protein